MTQCLTTTAGQLSALLDYISALTLLPEGHESEAVAAIERALRIVQAVGDRYRQQRDLLSLVLLYESAQAEFDSVGVLGRDNVEMARIQRQAADAFSVLDPKQANLVSKEPARPAIQCELTGVLHRTLVPAWVGD